MNLIGIEKAIPAVPHPTDDELRQVINETHAQGGNDLIIVSRLKSILKVSWL
jgi:hypothetical protein